MRKFNDKRSEAYSLIKAYWDNKDIDGLKNKINETCKKSMKENHINDFIMTAGSNKKFTQCAFHYLFIEKNSKYLDLGHLKDFVEKTQTIEHVISQNIVNNNQEDVAKSRGFDDVQDLTVYINNYGNLLSLERPLNSGASDRSDYVKKEEYQKSSIHFVQTFNPAEINKESIKERNDEMKKWLKEEFFKEFLD